MQSKLFDASLRAFTYIRNNKDPSTEPCGTPHTIFWKVVYKMLYFMNWFFPLVP